MGKRPEPKNSLAKTSGILALACNLVMSPLAHADESQLPLARAPGVSQEQLESIAEANARPTLADRLDMLRPGAEMSARLHRLVERGQSAWLSGSIDGARAIFKEIARLALEADWRPAQREAIQYAMLRLAQSAHVPTERDEWLERAVISFPDLAIDEDSFPPPLAEAFRSTRARLVSLAKTYSPLEHFPDHRYLLVNGKRFALTPELRLRLPGGTFRITALSDAFPPVTEKLTASQLEVFRLATPPIAAGSCDAPGALQPVPGIEQLSVVFSPDCVRSHGASGWAPKGIEIPELPHAPSAHLPDEALMSSASGMSQASETTQFPTETPAATVSSRTWLWAGLSAAAAFIAYSLVKDSGKSHQDPRVEPVHRTGL